MNNKSFMAKKKINIKEETLKGKEENIKDKSEKTTEKVDNSLEKEEKEVPKEIEQEKTSEQKLEELNEELDEQKNKYLRLFADFDNYKKRTAKERLDLLNTAGKDIMLSIIPTLDDLERALQSAENATDVDAVIEGFSLVKNKMFATLTQKGLKAMESKGEEFNPDVHEALTKIPAPTKDLKGKVVDVIEKGYTLNSKIIRYAKVVVGE